MSEKFSPALRITDLNDFIAPSQACIVSLKGFKASSAKPSDKPEVFFDFDYFGFWLSVVFIFVLFLICRKISCLVGTLIFVIFYYLIMNNLFFSLKVSTSKDQLKGEPVKISLKDCLACR